MLMRVLIVMAVLAGTIMFATSRFQDEDGNIDVNKKAEETGEQVQKILQDGLDARMEKLDNMTQ